MNWNPFKKKKGEKSVYVSIWLDKPLQGIHKKAPDGVWIKVIGIDHEAAAATLPGRTINWHIVPMSIRSRLEIDFKGVEMDWDEFRKWIV